MAGSVVVVVRTGAQVAIPLVTFAVGLGAGALRPAALRRHRALVGRSLLATLAIVPIVTALLVMVLPIAPEVRFGLLTMAIAVGPVAALRKTGKGNGEVDYALRLNLALLLASILYVPIAVALMGTAFHPDLHLQVRAVMRPVIVDVLLPSLAGLGLAQLAPRAAARLARPVSIAGNVLLALVAFIVFALLWRPLLRIGSAGLFATAAVAAVAIVTGHALGGPYSRTRMVLASFCTIRCPVMGIVIATATQVGKKILPVIIAYVLIGSVELVVYGLLRKATRPGTATHRPAPAGARAAF